jgi:iron complex outermembrane receptor protein
MIQHLQKSSQLLSAFLIYLPLTSNAGDIDDFEEDDFSLPVITSASRLSESVLSSPSSVTVIDRAMIDASGFLEIADLMRLVPGFIVSHAYGGNMAVISHGEGWEFPNRMQILIDGRSTYTNALSAIEWNALGVHIEDIERIEVVRGPAASAYGSNSYAGAINIVTKAPELDDKYHLRYRYGNIGEQELLLRHSGQVDNFDYRFTASSRNNKGFEEALEIRADPNIIFDDYRDNKDLNELSLTTRLRLSPTNSIWSNFSYTNSTLQTPNYAPEALGLIDDKDIDINAWSANIKWEQQLSEQEEISINFFHNYLDENDMTSFLLSNLLALATPPLSPAALGVTDQRVAFGIRSYQTHRSDLELEYSRLFNNGFQYVIGFGGRYDSMKSEAFFPTKGKVSNSSYRAFANTQIPFASSLTINIGGLYEKNRIEDSHFSPRASLNFHLNQHQSLRFGFSRAYRIPSLTEKNMDAATRLGDGSILDRLFRASSNIKAERLTSLDISYQGQSQTIPFSWEIRTYKEKYQDTIVFYEDLSQPTIRDDDIKFIANASESNMYGVEGELTFRPEKYSFIRLNFNLGHMDGKRLHRIEANGSATYKSLKDRAPKSTYGVLIGKQLETWSLGFGIYHVAKMKWDGFGDQVDSYNRLDATISKKIAISQNQYFLFKVAGQNITNNEYNEFMIDTDLTFEPRYYASISLIHD